MNKKILITTAATFLIVILMPVLASAVPLASPNYKLDPQGINAVGGQGSSPNYRMVSSGGEAVVGNGSGGSYKLSTGYVGALQQSIELTLTEGGLQAYYPLNTNTGIQAYNATANGNNGILIGSPNWTAGIIGQGLSFSGTNNVVVGSSFGLGAVNLTLSAWINLDSTSESGSFIKVGNAGNGTTHNGYGFGVGSSTVDTAGNNLILLYEGVRWINTSQSLGTGWKHIVMTIDASGVPRAYLNGTLLGTYPGTNAVAPSNNVHIGGYTSGSNNNRYSDVSIDEVRIFNRQLSSEEIRNLYDANIAGITNSVTIPQVVPGSPQTVGMDMTVITDAGGYNATISQDQNLTHSDSITTIAQTTAGNIATPGLWDDGITKGLGFTIVGGLSVPAKWGSGPVNYRYAALPTTPTAFFSRTGLSGGQKEVTNMQFKLDVPSNQKSGQYSNIATVTATLKP